MGDASDVKGYGRRTPELSNASLNIEYDANANSTPV